MKEIKERLAKIIDDMQFTVLYNEGDLCTIKVDDFKWLRGTVADQVEQIEELREEKMSLEYNIGIIEDKHEEAIGGCQFYRDRGERLESELQFVNERRLAHKDAINKLEEKVESLEIKNESLSMIQELLDEQMQKYAHTLSLIRQVPEELGYIQGMMINEMKTLADNALDNKFVKEHFDHVSELERQVAEYRHAIQSAISEFRYDEHRYGMMKLLDALEELT